MFNALEGCTAAPQNQSAYSLPFFISLFIARCLLQVKCIDKTFPSKSNEPIKKIHLHTNLPVWYGFREKWRKS